MMWLMDHVFKYTNFGLVSLIHGDFFIRQVRPKGRSPLTSCEVFVDVSVIRPLANSACHCRDDTARIQCRRYKTDDFSSRVSPPRSSPEGFSVTSVIGPFYAASPSTSRFLQHNPSARPSWTADTFVGFLRPWASSEEENCTGQQCGRAAEPRRVGLTPFVVAGRAPDGQGIPGTLCKFGRFTPHREQGFTTRVIHNFNRCVCLQDAAKP